MPQPPTDADLVVLGLLAEQPRHAYDLEAVIDERGVRRWTSLAFSSLYYVLNRLEQRGLVTSERAPGGAKARRVYRLTAAGHAACAEGTRQRIAEVPPRHAPVLVGMANSPLLAPDELARALAERRSAVERELAELRRVRARQEPLPRAARAIFDHSEAQLDAELRWTERVLTDTTEES